MSSEMVSSIGTSNKEGEEEASDPNYQNEIPLVSRSNLSSPASQLNTRQLLIRCVELVSQSDLIAAQRLVSLISSNSSPYGDSTDRLVHQFAKALSFRLNRNSFDVNLVRLSRRAASTNTSTEIISNPYHHHHQMISGSDVGGQDMMMDLQMEAVESSYLYLNKITPFIRFSHLTANQAILEATEGQDCIHILDLDTMQGLQWPPLMQAIAERHGRRSITTTTTSDQDQEEEASARSIPANPPMIRITGAGQDLITLQRTGDRLQKFAHSLGLRFQFRPLLIQSQGLSLAVAHLPSAVPLMPNEALIVNCVHFLHRFLRDDARLFLRAIRAMNPRVVTVAEREASHNHPFLQRFVQALDHYTALFDSLEATLPPNSRERLTVEQVWFGREILDLVAAEGDQRTLRHERFETWVELLRSSGFSAVPLSPYALSQAKLLLRLHYPSEGYQLQILNDSFFLGWQGQPLFSVSSWHA
ncbi:hypothetical protein NE237_001601 [Protea cynaroides]|uniref:Scarecrow-like protein 18 n=1 Tax=Protea cynaroides TaxID=273540 RepID=A0A9Q0QY94_9MAGN|nr:hypothetical protein NE237_001601 [Protea cynaroides]